MHSEYHSHNDDNNVSDSIRLFMMNLIFTFMSAKWYGYDNNHNGGCKDAYIDIHDYFMFRIVMVIMLNDFHSSTLSQW